MLMLLYVKLSVSLSFVGIDTFLDHDQLNKDLASIEHSFTYLDPFD